MGGAKALPVGGLNVRDANALDRMFSEENDWPQVLVRWRYIVLSTPRTGSSMLCSALAASGVAGRAIEYLNPANIRLYRQLRGPTSVPDILRDFESRRTSPNGVFGIKVHASQYQAIYQQGGELAGAGADFLRSFDRHILIYRRDKVDQAISRILAAEPDGEWNVPNGVRPPQRRRFESRDAGKIMKLVAQLASEEEYWRREIAAHSLTVIEVAYEDLAANTKQVLERVFAFLGVELPGGVIPMPTTKRRSNVANRALKQGFLAATRGVIRQT